VRDLNAKQLLAKVMGWSDDDVLRDLPTLQLLADYKYDGYQRFGPGKRFIESLALWLNQFDPQDRATALNLILDKLTFFSDAEFSHLVRTAYADLIVQERMRLVAEEYDEIPSYRVGAITKHPRFKELRLKSLYLGLSDGARTSELRRASDGEISNEQIWQAYELGPDKSADMLNKLKESLSKEGFPAGDQRFNLIWLIDDFSGSGNTYLRLDRQTKKFKGKIQKIYDQLNDGQLVDTSHYEVFLPLYVASRQAIDHIEYWAERFTSEHGYKPLQVRIMCAIERDYMVTRSPTPELSKLLKNPSYCDQAVVDKHFRIGGTDDAILGFAGCALPVVLSHNTPNNSVYILWGPESYRFEGLFPRLSRHREF
jgi:hypothetical protein